jgi:hypothetical protein
MLVVVMVVALEVNVELDSRDVVLFRSRRVQVISVELELFEFVFELMEIEAEVQQGSEKHIAADAAE